MYSSVTINIDKCPTVLMGSLPFISHHMSLISETVTIDYMYVVHSSHTIDYVIVIRPSILIWETKGNYRYITSNYWVFISAGIL